MVLIFMQGIRLSTLRNLVLFFVLIACNPSENKNGITLIWKNGRATALFIPKKIADGIPEDSPGKMLSIHLSKPGTQPAMLGEFKIERDAIIFEPLVPFTPGLAYTVKKDGVIINKFEVPGSTDNRPEVMAIYPTQDSLPLNLLKIYIHFSKPMREGLALQHVTLIKNRSDTMPGVFLDLSPELWNYNRTLLTMWLDPGRIKRDLQPNKRMGEPLEKGAHYTLVIDKQWTGESGQELSGHYQKEFVIVSRDSVSPDPARWKIVQPKSQTRDTLLIDFHESLDYSLSNEVIQITDDKGGIIEGNGQLGREEKIFRFVPAADWKVGDYLIVCEARLEDVAGNNLNRPFDRDMTQNKNPRSETEYKRKFILR